MQDRGLDSDRRRRTDRRSGGGCAGPVECCVSSRSSRDQARRPL